jgi:hypothetical protein
MNQIIVLQKHKNQFVRANHYIFQNFLFLFKDNLEHLDIIDHQKSIPFDEQLLDKIQFSALLMSFSGLKKNEMVISAVIDYFRSNYKETNDEKNEKKTLVSYGESFHIEKMRLNSCNNVLSIHNDVCRVIYSLKK